jgi:ABC-type uncharacterized transport system substrate-binding protein
MRRREFISLLGGAAAAWPLMAHATLASEASGQRGDSKVRAPDTRPEPGSSARAQQPERMRHIGALMLYGENDPEGQLRATAFRQELEKRGWTIPRTLQIDYVWGVGNSDWLRSAAAQLLRSAPDVILANGGSVAVQAVRQATRAVPVIFIGGADPVADGLVQSLAHPGGNITGFIVLEPSVGTKLLGLLKDVAPRLTRVAFMFNPDNTGNRQRFETTAAAAPTFAVEVIAAPVHGAAEIEAALERLGREPDHGLIVPPDPSMNTYRKLIVGLADRYRLPTIHALRAAAVEGGLMSYGVDIPDLFRQAAAYADRILKGEKPGDLPVQQPTKFELVINLKTAKALGLAVPDKLLALADEVIE